MADLSTTGTFTCPLLVENTPDLWKKAQIVGTQVHYTFKVAKTEEIFDFLVKKKNSLPSLKTIGSLTRMN